MTKHSKKLTKHESVVATSEFFGHMQLITIVCNTCVTIIMCYHQNVVVRSNLIHTKKVEKLDKSDLSLVNA